MPKAINRVSEFCDDGRIYICCIGEDKGVNHWLNATSKFFKHHMLVLHLC